MVARISGEEIIRRALEPCKGDRPFGCASCTLCQRHLARKLHELAGHDSHPISAIFSSETRQRNPSRRSEVMHGSSACWIVGDLRIECNVLQVNEGIIRSSGEICRMGTGIGKVPDRKSV